MQSVYCFFVFSYILPSLLGALSEHPGDGVGGQFLYHALQIDGGEAAAAVEDLAAYGQCTVELHLFAKDIDFVMNDAKLSAMYGKVAKGFPSSSGRLLFDTEPNVLGDTPDDFGFHVRIIRIRTTIKAI